MTWGGGKPHPVGDRGQRFEVRFIDDRGQEKVFGWSNDQAGADAMLNSIKLHPSMRDGSVIDRKPDEA